MIWAFFVSTEWPRPNPWAYPSHENRHSVQESVSEKSFIVPVVDWFISSATRIRRRRGVDVADTTDSLVADTTDSLRAVAFIRFVRLCLAEGLLRWSHVGW